MSSTEEHLYNLINITTVLLQYRHKYSRSSQYFVLLSIHRDFDENCLCCVDLALTL